MLKLSKFTQLHSQLWMRTLALTSIVGICNLSDWISQSNPELDIIPDLNLEEDEQMQPQSSSDIEIIEEQLHIEEDIQS